jgi:hemin uptake protein HemP
MHPGQPLPPAGATIGTPPETPEISSDALLGGRAEIRIRHRGEIYRLSLTRAGKLILHK